MSSPGQTGGRIAGGAQIGVGPGGKYFAQDFYVYGVTFGTFAPNAVVVQNIQIQSDSDFEWIMGTWHGNMNGATAPFQDTILLPISVALVDSGSSRQLFSQGVPITSLFGTGKQPFILPVSRLFRAYSNIQATLTSFDGTNTYNNVQLEFIGRKLFLSANQ